MDKKELKQTTIDYLLKWVAVSICLDRCETLNPDDQSDYYDALDDMYRGLDREEKILVKLAYRKMKSNISKARSKE